MKKKLLTNSLKAYEDIDFLKRDICRPIRLQLELLKPEVLLNEHDIHSTIVIFGSARTPAPEDAKQQFKKAEKLYKKNPKDPEAKQNFTSAKKYLEQSHYYKVARDFAKLVSSKCKNMAVVTGGGGGIMEAGNRGAHDVDAKSIGLNISLPFEQHANPYITEDLIFHFHYFSIRKMHFLLRAKAMCAFPGGFGTMDELFETLTLIQTRKIPMMPVVLFGGEFWNEIVNWHAFVERELICEEDLDIFHVCETAEEGWHFIQEYWKKTREFNVSFSPPPVA